MGQVIQEQLQVVLLPDSQCGFQRVCGCIDLMEKTREHDDSLFMMFVDLKEAYDSVPREALWTVLVKCGVPPIMLIFS